jgi:uroporphyrinogen-III synthase
LTRIQAIKIRIWIVCVVFGGAHALRYAKSRAEKQGDSIVLSRIKSILCFGAQTSRTLTANYRRGRACGLDCV